MAWSGHIELISALSCMPFFSTYRLVESWHSEQEPCSAGFMRQLLAQVQVLPWIGRSCMQVRQDSLHDTNKDKLNGSKVSDTSMGDLPAPTFVWKFQPLSNGTSAESHVNLTYEMFKLQSLILCVLGLAASDIRLHCNCRILEKTTVGRRQYFPAGTNCPCTLSGRQIECRRPIKTHPNRQRDPITAFFIGMASLLTKFDGLHGQQNLSAV